MPQTPEDYWDWLQEWLRRTGRVPSNTPMNPPKEGDPRPHPVAAGLMTALSVFFFVGSAIDHFDHNPRHYTVGLFFVLGGVALLVALLLWLDVLFKK